MTEVPSNVERSAMMFDVFPEPRDVDSGEGVFWSETMSAALLKPTSKLNRLNVRRTSPLRRLHDVLGLELFFERVKRQILLLWQGSSSKCMFWPASTSLRSSTLSTSTVAVSDLR